MADSLHLGLPYIAAAQAQKHITHNEALRALDALVMLSVLDRDLTAPPGSPAEGARYLVKATGTGGFAGKDNQIAHFRDGAWAFHAPHVGWIAYVADEQTLIVHDGAAWQPLLGAAPTLQNVSRFGLATIADATNPISAVLGNALFAARTVADGGDGNLRYKLSKEGAANTLSLLFQTGFSGRAEIGLAGDDDFHFKVSDDGTTWHEAIVIAADSGRVSFPQGAIGLREKLAADRTYYARTDGSDSNNGLADNAGGAFLTLQKALDVAATIDFGGFTVTIRIADGTYGGRLIVPVTVGQRGVGDLLIKGNAATPANVVLTDTLSFSAIVDAGAGSRVRIEDCKIAGDASTHLMRAHDGGVIRFQNVEFGLGFYHLLAESGGAIEILGDYAVSDDAYGHWACENGGRLLAAFFGTLTLSGSPAFSGAFAIANAVCAMRVDGNTFSGTATGARYIAGNNSVIDSRGSGASYLPGDAAGSVFNGGVYN